MSVLSSMPTPYGSKNADIKQRSWPAGQRTMNYDDKLFLAHTLANLPEKQQSEIILKHFGQVRARSLVC